MPGISHAVALTFLHSDISKDPAGVGLCPGHGGGSLDKRKVT